MPDYRVTVKAAYADRVRETYYVTASDRDEAAETYSEASPQTVEKLNDEGGDLLWSEIESIEEHGDGP